jgi:hypothetical protein
MTNLLPIACHIGILQKWDIKGFRTCKEGYRRTVEFVCELLVSLRTPLTPQPPLRPEAVHSFLRLQVPSEFVGRPDIDESGKLAILYSIL